MLFRGDALTRESPYLRRWNSHNNPHIFACDRAAYCVRTRCVAIAL